MGLDSFIFTGNKKERNLIQNPWGNSFNTYRKWWALHLYFFDQYDGDEVFNCKEIEFDVDELEDWFREQDEDFDEESGIDYDGEFPDDVDLAVFWRKHNHSVLEQLRSAVENGKRCYYNSWY